MDGTQVSQVRMAPDLLDQESFDMESHGPSSVLFDPWAWTGRVRLSCTGKVYFAGWEREQVEAKTIHDTTTPDFSSNPLDRLLLFKFSTCHTHTLSSARGVCNHPDFFYSLLVPDRQVTFIQESRGL